MIFSMHIGYNRWQNTFDHHSILGKNEDSMHLQCILSSPHTPQYNVEPLELARMSMPFTKTIFEAFNIDLGEGGLLFLWVDQLMHEFCQVVEAFCQRLSEV